MGRDWGGGGEAHPAIYLAVIAGNVFVQRITTLLIKGLLDKEIKGCTHID